MEIKEFKEKFKVGDEITCMEWVGRGLSSEKIALIGNDDFAFLSEYGDIQMQSIEYGDWIKPPELKEQDLAELFLAVLVQTYYGSMTMQLTFVNQKMFNEFQDRGSSHYITIKEAKERGLNLNLFKELL
jgi:hypothetical protein